MKLVKYTYAGTKKEEKFQNHDCKVCKNGEIFIKDLHFKYDLYGSNTSEPMCDECVTKYIIPNYDFSKHLMEGTKMNDGWIKSKPFKTAEGYFTIDHNRILHKARVEYKGVTYEGNLSEIVDFIAHKGIEHENGKKELPPPPPPPMDIPLPPPPVDVLLPPPPPPVDMDLPPPPPPPLEIPLPPTYGIVR